MVHSFSAIFRSAWQLTWRYKHLWFFGLFVALITQEVEIVLRDYFTFTDQTLSLASWQELFRNGFGGVAGGWWDTLTSSPLVAVMSVIIILAVLVLFVWLMIQSVGGIIWSTVQWDNKKLVTFAQGIAAGHAYFWKNLIIYAAARIADAVILAAMALLVSVIISSTAGFIISGLLIIITLAACLIISFVAKFAACYVVTRGETAWQAIRSAWKLFTANWLDSIEMALLTFVINFAVNLIVLLVLVLVAVPFFLLVIILNNAAYVTLANFLFGIGLTLILLITVVAGAALSGFQYSAWVLVFLRLDQGRRMSKILQWTQRLMRHGSGQSGQRKLKPVQ